VSGMDEVEEKKEMVFSHKSIAPPPPRPPSFPPFRLTPALLPEKL